MMPTMKATLTKETAPAYWSRWRVNAPDGRLLGTVEKRGGFARWTALDRTGAHVGSMLRTRDDAVARLVEIAEGQA